MNKELPYPGQREKTIIAAQLDSALTNVFKVIKKCPAGFPQLLLLKPFTGELISPTIFWLSCPRMRKEIGRLEDQGLLKELTDKYQQDLKFAKKLQQSHKEYAALRRQLLSKEDKSKAREISANLLKTLLYSGVGGIKDKAGLKCLHTHFAHYYADYDNPVGAEVSKRLIISQDCNLCQKYLSGEENNNQ